MKIYMSTRETRKTCVQAQKAGVGMEHETQEAEGHGAQ